ncbi:dual specificity calcium/calmodulin-dependent 3',5'-cyclic nucleotide phosphodiesterase 1A-like isoform X1 [Tachypleus tridentatus]|uniref:dual specificity calcium/calmodulin-dependent 3',5'-cyclic nucleotide phosphodiesterase 1A-like isoform X1 n=1 Tax=Tachypleus tridentatus TaxID=6853 RepID=UPI003FD428E2
MNETDMNSTKHMKDLLLKSNSVPLMARGCRREDVSRRCRLRLDGYSYLIVANPPESQGTKDEGKTPESEADLSQVGGFLVRRTHTRGGSISQAVGQGDRSLKTEGSTFVTFPPVDAADTKQTCEKAALRLRELSEHLTHGDVPVHLLQETLRYAVCVLEAISMEEARWLMEEDEDDLSEVHPDAVPNEVREWLASTFTRQAAAQRVRSDDKPRFRSVANAIRAGIMVDRIYRRLSSSSLMQQMPPQVMHHLKNIDEWSFDVFAVNEAASGQVLRYISYDLLNRYGIIHKFKIPTAVLENFLVQIELGYGKHKNPYHNNIHAADVTQTVHYMIWHSGLANWLTDLEVFATLFSAIIHDFEHTGTTNNFHVMSGSDTALLYNDRAVLENHHLSAAFKLLKEEDYNILQNFSKEEFREFRALSIEMVLGTDMSSHFHQLKTMKTLLSHREFSVDKPKALSLLLHCCDISHPSKNWKLHHPWTQLLMEEFFQQGDKEHEMGLPYSPLCDRNTTLVAESQIGFIEFIVAPSMEVCGDLLEKIQLELQLSRSPTVEESILEETSENKTDKKLRTKSLSAMRPSSRASSNSLPSDGASIYNESTSARPPPRSAPASPRSPYLGGSGAQVEVPRPWIKCLEENRVFWQGKAAKDAELQSQQVSADRKSDNDDSDPAESASYRSET